MCNILKGGLMCKNGGFLSISGKQLIINNKLFDRKLMKKTIFMTLCKLVPYGQEIL
jgi:hypothetical protein